MIRRAVCISILTALISGLGLGFATNSFAQSADKADTIKGERERLNSIELEIESADERRQSFEERVEDLRIESRNIQVRLVGLAASVQSQETRVSSLEERLEAAESEERIQTANLQRREQDLATSISAFIRLSRQPTAVLISRPSSSIDTARTVSLLARLVPTLKSEAETLGLEIARLQALRALILDDQEILGGDLTTLDQRRQQLRQLITSTANERAISAKDEALEMRRLVELTQDAETLQELIVRLEADARAGRSLTSTSGMLRSLVLPAGSLPFSSAQGEMPVPAEGRIIVFFGSQPSNGPDSAANSPSDAVGITVQTRNAGQVIAPHDGQVVYSGVFRGYGQLLIISHGEGYHTLLAGMARIDARVGQWLLAGEPVGQMGTMESGATKLYVELRRDGKPIDPALWLVARG